MNKILSALFLFISSLHQLSAQIFPLEGSKLYYRFIGFSCPQTGAITYKVEIAKGSYDTENSFEKNITVSVLSKKNKIIAEVPSFGCQYTWRVVSVTNNNIKTISALHHFYVTASSDVDTAVSRLRIIRNAEKYKDDYVFIDGSRVLYDMKGNPVWFLPGTELINAGIRPWPRDMKLSPQGTITFIAGYQSFEINYNGNILWHYKGNGGNQNLDTFHHDFTRLHNGHYMGLLFENMITQVPLFKDSLAKNANDSAVLFRKMKFNTIVEYDEKQHVVWRWNCYDYLRNSDLFSHKTSNAPFDLNDLHENSFYFDEQNKMIYLSFRNVNRIIKIKYPEGNVLNIYGPEYHPGAAKMDNSLFCGQHSLLRSHNGYLYVFNNNTCNPSHIPTILCLQEPAPGETDLKKIWEYQCAIEDTGIANKNLSFYSGGNVIELPGQSVFVSMGVPYCKVFIVTHEKKILWSAIPERFDLISNEWKQPTELYRASIISRKQLEQLIWNSEK